MAPVQSYLEDPEYANWVKSALAFNITNEVLRPFVVKGITQLHQSIVKKLPSGVSCTGCSVKTPCQNGICDEIKRQIEYEHWYPNPSFTNTFTGRWRTEPWEIAKCFMPPSKRCRSISASDADFTVSINVIINCKHFMAFGTSDPEKTETDCSKSRDFRNSVMHAFPQKVSEHDMKENLNILINILNMVKTPETNDDTEEAIKKIEKIKTNQLEIKLKDIIEVQTNATEAIADDHEKPNEKVQRERLLVNFEACCRKALCRLTEEHISKQEGNLSVAAFLSKIFILAESTHLCSTHQDMLFPKSDLCKNLNDTGLNTEITEIFNKDSPDVDVTLSNSILVSWWRDEEDYGNKQVLEKHFNESKQTLKKVEKIKKFLEEKFGYREEDVTLQGTYETEIDTACEIKARGCDKGTEQAIQKDFTSANNNNTEKKEAVKHFCEKTNVREADPAKGSIILNVKCSSITNVINFWDSCIDGRAVEALSKVRDYYRRYYKCDTLEFDVILSKKEVSRCVNEIVESLTYHFEGLIEFTHKVQETLEEKDERDSLHISGQVVSLNRSSNSSTSSGYVEVNFPLERTHDVTVKKLKRAEKTIQKLEKQLAEKTKDINSLKKRDKKIESDFVEKNEEIKEILLEIEISNEEKQSLAQKVDELANELYLMKGKSAETEARIADQDRKIEQLQDRLGKLRLETRAPMMQNVPQRTNAQTHAIYSSISVPNASMHRSPGRATRPVNAAQSSSTDPNVPERHDEPARLLLPKINDRK